MEKEKLWSLYIKTKDKSIKDQLIIAYIELVRVIAGRLYVTYANHVEFDDLVSYGVFGLLDAIDKFDPSKKVKFETYAYIRIRGAIIDQLRTLDWIPRSVRQKYKQIEDAYQAVEKRLGRSAKDEEVAKELNVSMERLNTLLSQIHSFTVVSLEEKIQNHTNFTIADEYVDRKPEQYYEKEELKKILLDTLKDLSDREKKIISLYYYSELTYKEISKLLGVSESRISQIHTKTIIKLRRKMDNII